MRYEPQYLGEIDLSEETLAHYGVLGMKWHKRKAKRDSKNRRRGIKVNHKSNAKNYSSNTEKYLDRFINANTHAERMAMLNAALNAYNRSVGQGGEKFTYNQSEDELSSSPQYHYNKHTGNVGNYSGYTSGREIDSLSRDDAREAINYERTRSRYRKKK